MSTHESTASEIPTAVIVHLSGRYRGTTHRLFGERLRIGTRPDDEITFSKFDLTPGLSKLPETGPYATLERRGNSYELRAEPDADIWVDGRARPVVTTFEPIDAPATLTARLSANSMHELLLGTLPLGRALLFRKLKVSGSKSKAMKLEPLLHSCQAVYPNIAAERL